MLTAHCQFLLFCSVPLAFFLCPTPGCRTCRHPDVERADTRMSNMPRPGCRTCRDPDVEHAEIRVLNMSRPGCHTIPFRISVFSFSFPLFSFARMRIYYNVSLLPDFSSSLKKYVLQHVCQSAFYKNVQEKREKIPLYIWLVCYKVLLLHPLSRTGAAMY